ncbi:MAG: hypothetical protein LBO66_09415 [Deltaproteobacteria bacterium]|jgi:hypothetical protein|nr:hypothetical protein [Deltaproteobacteria bacterium]
MTGDDNITNINKNVGTLKGWKSQAAETNEDEIKRLSLKIAPEKHKKLKVYAANNGKTMLKVINEIIDAFLRENCGDDK